MGDACGRVLEWELGLPAAGELTPLSHPLISRTLAAAFKINLPGFPPASPDARLSSDSPTSHLSFPHDDDDEEEAEEEEEGTEDSTGGGGGDGREGGGAGRGGKKPRMVWTAELHHRFVEAVAHLGEKDAVPKAIVQLMNVEGLTRENVASHLQKYRLYLKRTRAAAAPSPPSVARFGGSPPSPGQRLQPPPIAPVSWPHAHRDGEKLGCWLLVSDSLFLRLLPF